MDRRGTLRRSSAPLLAIGLLLGCRDDALSEPARSPDCLLVEDGFGPAAKDEVRAEVVVSGLEVPWGIAWLPNGDMLVTEREGRLRLVRDGKLVEAPVATIEVSSESEDGLLGIALHPDFADNRSFFLYFTRKDGGETGARVQRFELAQDATSATAGKVVQGGIPAARYHSGGRIRIGPDKLLYIGTGDSRKPDLSQDWSSLAGKILRVTPDGAVPPDNPRGSAVFIAGIRNTQGFDWLTPERLVVSDHGPSGELGRRGGDELSVARAGDNLGWPTIWKCESKEGMVTPALTWDEAVPPGGAAVYTGAELPEWKGSVLIGSLGARHLHRVVFDDQHRQVRSHEVHLKGDHGRLRDVVMGPDGHLYVTTSNCDGRGTCGADKDAILRIRKE
jgi:glucose/arabinose dehydrogenase